MPMREKAAEAIGCMGGGAYMLLLGTYVVSQIVAAMLGYSEIMNAFLAGALVAACLMLGFTLPITVGAFLGALWVFQWPWYGALIFAFPGLIFVIPGMLATLWSTWRDARH